MTILRPQTNIVRKDSLRDVQGWTFRSMAKAIKPSVGPNGSTTQIIKTTQIGEIGQAPEYTKDGYTIGKYLKYTGAIEDSLQKEMVDMTKYIVDTVGDGTSSTYLMTSLIFDNLVKTCDRFPAYKIIQTMDKIVKKLQSSIMARAKELDLDAIYDIAMISTNSNVKISTDIRNIYEQYGMNAYISLESSNDEKSYIRTYEGLTLEAGTSDECYINTIENGHNLSVVSEPRIYTFVDPIDTAQMQVFLENIIKHNIFERANAGEPYIPTVIIAPKISLDASSFLDKVQSLLTRYTVDNYAAKPPLNIITNFGSDPGVTSMYTDIARLCGCPIIKKYINVAVEQKEQAEGIAPTDENIFDFYGTAEMVKSDSLKTTFINPLCLVKRYTEDVYEGEELVHKKNDPILDEDGMFIKSNDLDVMIKYYEDQLAEAKKDGEDADLIGGLIRKINALKSVIVDYVVGGVTLTERDSVKALADDAIKNIRSASKFGYGYACNFEGFRAAIELYESDDYDNFDQVEKYIVTVFVDAYQELQNLLYSTVYYKELDGFAFDLKEDYDEKLNSIVTDKIDESLIKGCPMNFTSQEYDGKVLCSIKQDVEILEVISKIISIVFTTNQSLLQNPGFNVYGVDDEDVK